MNKRSFLLFPFLLIIVCSSCRKSLESQLPPPTKKGANTAGCIMDSKLWIGQGCMMLGAWAGENDLGHFYYDVSNKRIKIEFTRCVKYERSTFSLYIEQFTVPGTYFCNKQGYIPGGPGSPAVYNNRIEFYYSVSAPHEERTYKTFEHAIGSITITKIDTVSRPAFISGTFECRLKNQLNFNDSLIITKGRFDIIYPL